MKSGLLFDFNVNKENKTINVTREFAADKDTVWEAWTEKEILDQWWAPKPWKTDTKSMDFREGGRWLYAMRGPEGEEHWSFSDFTSVSPKDNYQFSDGFCDSEGNMNHEMPTSDWSISFKKSGNSTIVDVKITYGSLKDLEGFIEMGFKEGFTMAMENLDELFANR